MFSCSSDETSTPVTPEKKKYPLTVNIEGEGEVLEEIVNTGRTTDYNSGTTVKLTAVPAEGWEFLGWSGAIESTELEVQLLVSEAKEVNAIFKFKEIINNLLKESYSYFNDNFKIGDVINFDEIEFQVESISVFNDEGWKDWMEGVYGLRQSVYYIKLKPLNCYNSELHFELFYNIQNGEFLMLRTNGLNNNQTFHFLIKRYYSNDFNPQFNDNSQAKFFDDINFAYKSVLDLILPLSSVKIEEFQLEITVPNNGYYILKNLFQNKLDTIYESTKRTVYSCDKFIISAYPKDGFHFDGWLEPVLDTLQLFPSLQIDILKSINISSKFIYKDVGGKKVVPKHNCSANDIEPIRGDLLNYRNSENFIVWWDKNWHHNHDSKEVLRWAEFTYNKCKGYGMESFNKDFKTNIYLHHVSDGLENKDIFSDSWGQGSAICGNASIITHPYPNGNSVKSGEEYNLSNHNKISINPLYPKLNVHHEVFHVMQQKPTNNGTFPYGGDYAWYTEATADWFEVKFLSDSHPSKWRHIPFYLLFPHKRLWDNTNIDNYKHLYGAQILLFYLEWNNIVEESFFGKSYYSGTKLTPQEYMFNEIPDFKNHFIDFAGHATVIDFTKWNDKITQQKDRYISERYNNIDLSYELILNDKGYEGIFTPINKIESWAYQTVVLKSSQVSRYKYKFTSDGVGSEGGTADFNLIIVKERNGQYTYEKKEITNNSIEFELSTDNDSDYYFTIVNTPNKFIGKDTFNYSLELKKL
jgi:hypothetical protein